MITNHHKTLGHFRKIASLAIWGQEIGMEYLQVKLFVQQEWRYSQLKTPKINNKEDIYTMCPTIHKFLNKILSFWTAGSCSILAQLTPNLDLDNSGSGIKVSSHLLMISTAVP